MTADAGILTAGASKIRNGNRYRADTHERQTALDPNRTDPIDLAYHYQTFAELKAAAAKYIGKVTAIQPGGKFEAVETKVDEEGPIDFFAMQPDSSYVRSNKFGEPTTALETLKQDHSGVIATGEVGPGGNAGGQSQVAVPGREVPFVDKATKQPVQWPANGRQSIAEATTLMGGETGVYGPITVPVDVKGIARLRFDGLMKSAANPNKVRIEVDGVQQGAPRDDGGGFTMMFAIGVPPTSNCWFAMQPGQTFAVYVTPAGDGQYNGMFCDIQTPAVTGIA